MAKYCYSKGPAGDYGFRVVDGDYVAQQNERLFDSMATPEQLSDVFADYTKDAANASIKHQLAELESMVTLRMMGEAFTGSVAVINKQGSPFDGMTSAQAISYVEQQKATLRAQLQS